MCADEQTEAAGETKMVLDRQLAEGIPSEVCYHLALNEGQKENEET